MGLEPKDPGNPSSVSHVCLIACEDAEGLPGDDVMDDFELVFGTS